MTATVWVKNCTRPYGDSHITGLVLEGVHLALDHIYLFISLFTTFCIICNIVVIA